MKPEAHAEPAKARGKKRDRRAYSKTYYRQKRARIRLQQKETCQGKYTYASPELQRHLKEHPIHARGWERVGLQEQQIACAECEGLDLTPMVCLECWRNGLKQIGAHTWSAHRMPIEVYNRRWGYSAGATSLEFHKKRSQLSRSTENVSRLKSLSFTSDTARRVNLGRRHTLREKRRMPNHAPPRQTKLSRRLGKRNVPYWAVASRHLNGEQDHQIASELHVSLAWVGSKRRAMGLGGRPSYWRGEVVSHRHLLNLMRDFRLSEVEVARRMEQPLDWIRQAVSHKTQALHPDHARAVLELNKKLRNESRSVSPTPEGGRPRKLLASEMDEIPWKSRVVASELRSLHRLLPSSTQSLVPEKVGESLCLLARQGKVKILLLWAHEFLKWLGEKHDFNAESLSDHQAAARDFIATQYGISERTLDRLLAKHAGTQTGQASVEARTLLLDVRTAMGDRSVVSTSQLLSTLGALRPRWKKLHPHRLAAMLEPFELRPRNLRLDGAVVKGYRRLDLRVYSTQEVAREIGRALPTLRQWISVEKIPVPPIVASIGVRGAGRVLLWTSSDIDAVKASIAAQPPQAFRRPRSATAHSDNAAL
jgi:hypothetical protein